MISSEYQKILNNRVEKLQKYISHIEENYFNIADLQSLSLKGIMERYDVAKNALNKEVDNIIKIEKSDSSIDGTTKTLLNIIMSMNERQKALLKESVTKIIQGDK